MSTGKILAIDVDNGVLDPIHDRLPKELRARTPEQVGSVLLVTCTIQEVGTYFLWAKGYSHSCRGTLINWPSQQVLDRFSSTNSPPRGTYFPFWSHTASRPTRSLADRMVQLGETPEPAP